LNEIVEAIKARRTIRKYKPEQIEEEKLDAILAAGLHAPSIGGRQASIIVVCQNSKLNEELGRMNRLSFEFPPNIGRITRNTNQPGINDDATIQSAFYNAPTVLTIFAQKTYNLTGESFAVAENILVAAHSLGIGGCIVARAIETFATKRGRQIQINWGLGFEYEAKLHITLGYLQGEPPKDKIIREGRIIRV